jgi:hypothetical protein
VVCCLRRCLCFVLQQNSAAWFHGYKLGFELLILNGLLTFLGFGSSAPSQQPRLPMNHREQFDALLSKRDPFLALAPMQDVTDAPFWHLMHRYGGADVYWTEYFRVHAVSRPAKNGSGNPSSRIPPASPSSRR